MHVLQRCVVEVSELNKQNFWMKVWRLVELAEDNRLGYFCIDNVLMRSRMNDIGEQIVQIVSQSHIGNEF